MTELPAYNEHKAGPFPGGPGPIPQQPYTTVYVHQAPPLDKPRDEAGMIAFVVGIFCFPAWFIGWCISTDPKWKRMNKIMSIICIVMIVICLIIYGATGGFAVYAYYKSST